MVFRAMKNRSKTIDSGLGLHNMVSGLRKPNLDHGHYKIQIETKDCRQKNLMR
jgi:hypothetical protein